MIPSFLLLIGVGGIGLIDYFYRSTLTSRERNRFIGNWTAFLFFLVSIWEWSYWYQTKEVVALGRGLLALLGIGVAFWSRINRLGKKGSWFYIKWVASWVGFSVALTFSRKDFLILFLGWEWGWFWFIHLVGYYSNLPGNRALSFKLHGVSLITSGLIGFGFYALPSENAAIAVFCFLIGWGFRLAVVPFYFWGLRALDVSPLGIFFTTAVFLAQCFFGLEFKANLTYIGDIQVSWERGLWFLSVANLALATLLLFWQRSLKQWLFFLYLLQNGWVFFLLAQPQTQVSANFCILVAVINLGLWAIVSKVAQQTEGQDAIVNFVCLVDRDKVLGLGFLIFISCLVSLLAVSSITFLFSSRLGQIVAAITFFSILACFQILKKILIRQPDIGKFKLDWSEKIFFILLIGFLFFGMQRFI